MEKKMKKRDSVGKVVLLNPRTCGIYKKNSVLYRIDPSTGKRTEDIDNELIEHVDLYLAGKSAPGRCDVSLQEVQERGVLVPAYYDRRHDDGITNLLKAEGVDGITIGELLDSSVISSRGGHGSPGNDQRTGSIPYVKVSDVRGLRVNVNPSNLVTKAVAKRFWRGEGSGLEAWDVLTPNRASKNIGEFAIILPGEERIVITKEVFIFRVLDRSLFDPFYLLWSLSLQVVRNQWRRIALMQTNREDCGDRHREIIIPRPPSREWVANKSKGFRDYFTKLASAKQEFMESIAESPYELVSNANPFPFAADE